MIVRICPVCEGMGQVAGERKFVACPGGCQPWFVVHADLDDMSVAELLDEALDQDDLRRLNRQKVRELAEAIPPPDIVTGDSHD